MKDLLIYLSLIPVAFFPLVEKKRELFLWLPAMVAMVCIGASFWDHRSDPFWWLPVMAFFCFVGAHLSEKKILKPVGSLGALFFCQALLCSKLAPIILCLTLGDMCLIFESYLSKKDGAKSQSIQNIYKSVATLFPAFIGVILQPERDLLAIVIALSIILRVTSWPLKHWLSETDDESRYYRLLVSAVSTFALWHTMSFSTLIWGPIWLSIAVVLSFGINYEEILILVALGFFCISSLYGLLAVALWPLLLHRGKPTLVTPLFLAVMGLVIIQASVNMLGQNPIYVLACVSALSFARVFAATQIRGRPWASEIADGLLAGLLLISGSYFLAIPPLDISIEGFLFGGIFLVAFAIGKFFFAKKPNFFMPLKAMKEGAVKAREDSRWEEAPGRGIDLKPWKIERHLLNVLEGEGRLVWLLGILGLALMWRVV